MLVLQHYLLTLCALYLNFKRPPTGTYLHHNSAADSFRFPRVYFTFFYIHAAVYCILLYIFHSPFPEIAHTNR